ncbi:uncharacterized protein PWA37_000804 [Arxiozyma heterogenica]|uniref:uncharacterized protein n=1 Tax=Arxiozyma heterogenica TaxID=278026 RepID=UPI002EF212EE
MLELVAGAVFDRLPNKLLLDVLEALLLLLVVPNPPNDGVAEVVEVALAIVLALLRLFVAVFVPKPPNAGLLAVELEPNKDVLFEVLPKVDAPAVELFVLLLLLPTALPPNKDVVLPPLFVVVDPNGEGLEVPALALFWVFREPKGDWFAVPDAALDPNILFPVVVVVAAAALLLVVLFIPVPKILPAAVFELLALLPKPLNAELLFVLLVLPNAPNPVDVVLNGELVLLLLLLLFPNAEPNAEPLLVLLLLLLDPNADEENISQKKYKKTN